MARDSAPPPSSPRSPSRSETRKAARSPSPGRSIGRDRPSYDRLGRRQRPDRHGCEQRHRNGHHEQRAPAEAGHEQTADQWPDRRARRDEHVEQAEGGAAPIGRCHRPQQRDRARRDEPARRRLQNARRRQHLERAGRCCQCRGKGEPGNAEQEHPPVPEPIPKVAADRQRDRDRAEVQRHQRCDRGRADVELAHHARQGDGEHRGVERDEDRAGRQPEHRPADEAWAR